MTYTLWPIRPYQGIWAEASEWRAQFEATRPDAVALRRDIDRLCLAGWGLEQAYRMAQYERDEEGGGSDASHGEEDGSIRFR